MAMHNVQGTLDLAVQSILQQSYKEFEFIIIDDASTDNSLRLVKAYRDPRIQVLQNTDNLGLAKSLNKAIRASRGEYIARMDADDVSDLSRLGKQIEYLNKNPLVDVLGTNALLIDKKGNALGIKQKPRTFTRVYACFSNPVIHPSVMFRRRIFERVEGYPNWKRGQDYGFFALLLAQNNIIENIREPLIKYRSIPKSKVALGKGRFAARRLLVLGKKLPQNDNELIDHYGARYTFTNRIEDLLCLLLQKIVIMVDNCLDE